MIGIIACAVHSLTARTGHILAVLSCLVCSLVVVGRLVQEDLWSKLMIAPLFNNSIHGDVLMRRDWIDTCLKYKPQGEVKDVIDLVSTAGLERVTERSAWAVAVRP